MSAATLVWFRLDLRLTDHPAPAGTAGYPQPIVNHAQARAQALEALAAIKKQ